MTSPGLEDTVASTRTELEMRELIRAKIRAWTALEIHGMTNIYGMTEDERIDLEVERYRLQKIWEDAHAAIYNYKKVQQ